MTRRTAAEQGLVRANDLSAIPLGDLYAAVRDRGKCVGTDAPEVWECPPGAATNLSVAKAAAACFGCPVRDECLEYALQTGTDTGVWGGMVEGDLHVELLTRYGFQVGGRVTWFSEGHPSAWRTESASSAWVAEVLPGFEVQQ